MYTMTAMMSVITITTTVAERSSWRVGHDTLGISTRSSFRNSVVRCTIDMNPPRWVPRCPERPAPERLARLEGFEPPALGFGDRCSNRTELQACDLPRLAGLLVRRMLATERAELLVLDPARVQTLVLFARIVAVPARPPGRRDHVAHGSPPSP